MNAKNTMIVCAAILGALLTGLVLGLWFGENIGEGVARMELAPLIERNALDVAALDANLAAMTDRLIALSESMAYVGLASWYGTGGEHGRIGANGKRFDMNEMTAAAKRLPFGSRWIVRRMDTGASVIVTVTDDGPNVSGRMIDLSFAAAKSIGMLDAGLVKVRISPIGE
jgi:rare lipoprotein A